MKHSALPLVLLVTSSVAACLPVAHHKASPACSGYGCSESKRRATRPAPVPNAPTRVSTRRPPPRLAPLPPVALPAAPGARLAAVKAFVGRHVRAERADGAYVEARLASLDADGTLRFSVLDVAWPIAALTSLTDLTPAPVAAPHEAVPVPPGLEPVDVTAFPSPFDAERHILPFVGHPVRVVLLNGTTVEGVLTSIRASRLVVDGSTAVDLAEVARVMHRDDHTPSQDRWDRDA